jgi:cytosol alanyl aminopeptidase
MRRSSTRGATATPVLRTAARNADASLFDTYVAALRKAEDRGVRSELYKALGYMHDPALLRRAFELALAPDFDVREASEIYWGAADETGNAGALLAFVREHADVLMRRLPEESAARMPRWHQNLCSAGEREQLAQLYRPRMHALSGGGRNLAQTLEAVDICVRGREVNVRAAR